MCFWDWPAAIVPISGSLVLIDDARRQSSHKKCCEKCCTRARWATGQRMTFGTNLTRVGRCVSIVGSLFGLEQLMFARRAQCNVARTCRVVSAHCTCCALCAVRLRFSSCDLPFTALCCALVRDAGLAFLVLAARREMVMFLHGRRF